MTRLLRLGLACVMLVGGAACQKFADPNSRLNEYIRRLEPRVVPRESRLISRTGPVVQKMTLRAEWEFESDWTSQRYESWLKDGFASEFKSRIQPHGLLLTRYDGAEYQSIDVMSVAKNGRLDVHVVFTTYPD